MFTSVLMLEKLKTINKFVGINSNKMTYLEKFIQDIGLSFGLKNGSTFYFYPQLEILGDFKVIFDYEKE